MGFSHPTHKPLAPGQDVTTTGEVLGYAAATYPEKTALIEGDRRWTYWEFDQLANRFAHAVMTEFAKQEGPVGIIGRNSAEYAVAHFGTGRSGRYSINLPTRCSEEDLVFTVNLTKPVILVMDRALSDFMAQAQKKFEHSPHFIFVDDGPGEPGGARSASGKGASAKLRGTEFWEFIDDRSDIEPDIEIDPDSAGSVIFTGGTTGRPKAALTSHRARAISAMAAVEDYRLDSDAIAGYTVPFTHAAGLFSWFQPVVLAGCTGVVFPKWDPELVMQEVERHGITVILLVPSQLALLLNHPTFDSGRLKSLERIILGGAPVSEALLERTETTMPWLYCARAYGSTETGHLSVQIKPDRVAVPDGYNQPGGRLEIEIFKEPGVPAKVGEMGEVATRGGHLLTKYLGDDAAQAEFFKLNETEGDWGWMGDLAVKHDGYFSLAGRSKHMILSGGLNIYPAELEDILERHPDVADCVVFGWEDEVWGEVPVAAVVLRNDRPDTEEMMAFVAERLTRYKRLRQIFVLDQIPRTGAGKAQLFLVKELCEALPENDT